MMDALASGMSAFVMLALAPLVIAGFAIAYVSLRIRDARSETPDPELGIKAAYHTFLTAGILLALSGLTISAVDFLSEALQEDDAKPIGPVFRPQPKFGGPFQPQPQPQFQPDDPFDRLSQRVALPLIISGILFSLVSLLLLRAGTNNAHFPTVGRTFGGLRMIVGGLAVMFGVTFAIQLMFLKELETVQPFSLSIALIGIWFPAAAIELFAIKRSSKLPYYVPPKPKKDRRRDDEFEDEDRDREERRSRKERREREERRERDDSDESRDERRRPPPPPRRPREEES